MFFHPKNLKSNNNNPWFKPCFNILLHTQWIVCATENSQCLEYLECISLAQGYKSRLFWNGVKPSRQKLGPFLINKLFHKWLTKDVFFTKCHHNNVAWLLLELNYFGAIAQFFQFRFRGHWQVAHKWRFMRHLSVSPVPKTGKTVHLPQSNSTPQVQKFG